MEKFYVGQSVICVNDIEEHADLRGLQVNHIYTVEGFNEYDGGLILFEVKSEAYKGSYNKKRFVTLGEYQSRPLNMLLQPSEIVDSLDFNIYNNKSAIVKSRIATFCDITVGDTGIKLATGVAYCGDNDKFDEEFDEEFGERLALKRALQALTDNYGFDKEFREEIWRQSGLA